MDNLVCSKCKAEYSINEPVWKCRCGGLLNISYTPLIDLNNIKYNTPGMWRYRENIPISKDKNIVSFSEGFTPLLKLETGAGTIFVKQDHLFPTGSYKDRGASVLISKVKELGIKKVVEDSSGNAGAAIAAYCAKADIECEIYVPEKTSEGKLAQIEFYGATLHKVPGSREKTAEAVLDAADKYYYASHSWNPWFFQGTKTFAYEVCEQLGWEAPEVIVLPAGNGTLFLGTFIGFKELQNSGIIENMPKMIAIQTANCAPLYESYLNNLEEPSCIDSMETLAEGIAIAEPIRGHEILKAVRVTEGQIITVTEVEIEISLRKMMSSGYYIEPSSAAVIAGVIKYQTGNQSRLKKERIVSVFTGHGLKSTSKLLKLITTENKI